MNILAATKMLFGILSNTNQGLMNVTCEGKRILVYWRSVIPGHAPNYFDGYEVIQIHWPDKEVHK